MTPIAAFFHALKKYVFVALVAAAVALFLRAYVFETYHIPNDYMSPALLPGDYIFVNKLFRGELRRGDVVVFSFLNDPRKDFIKRVVGLSGDRLEIREGRLFVNGQPMSEPVQSQEGGDALFFQESFESHSYTVRWSGTEEHPEELSMIDLEVPEGQVFVLGDNRVKGRDSREWGFLRKDFIKGKAAFIWLSVGKKVRWSRIFKGMD